MAENIIYCYSGTGNCLDIAMNIAKELGDTDIVMMRSFPSKTDATEYKRVGFVFPCYGGGLPGMVEDYLKSIHIGIDAYTFGVVSYAGYPGCGLDKLNAIHPLSYWAGISHQCSCIWLFPHFLMMPPLTPALAQKRSERLAKQVAVDVKAGKTKKAPHKMLINALESSAWPTLSKLKAQKLTVCTDTCVSCGQCAKLCPQGNITIKDGHPSFGDNCIQCLGCLQFCPTGSINMGKVTQRREHYHNKNITPDMLMQKEFHF